MCCHSGDLSPAQREALSGMDIDIEVRSVYIYILYNTICIGCVLYCRRSPTTGFWMMVYLLNLPGSSERLRGLANFEYTPPTIF